MNQELSNLAKSYETRLRQWANRYCEFLGDDKYVSYCDKWCQQLNDEPESLIQLLDDAEFLKVMADATIYMKSKKLYGGSM